MTRNCTAECKADITEVKNSTAGLPFHDIRHNKITKLCESGASEQTVMSIAGHVSRKMLEHYSHIRLEAKRDAVRALSTTRETAETVGHVQSTLQKGFGCRSRYHNP